ncbi:flagellar hook-associated protein FlgK [Variovorax arabinosiphilus]|uniref:flagellar hook-associated protein FlgK n=1 Tax=Variovorax arabinosiphilus TaxID=3053498 RepID=UPI002579228E|nr:MULTISPECIES: flagellar hook-associated protein FlgK [unclassified Variovorax]MDM0118162.1 flagellar hook-associated protein FlgK [Variovorax sp. J2L1-78]MDM0128587.1 flagellar hook-associated protein FlgK [Variovorax sp. J2L1-63]MDM0233627.1 flagellar hook-associated protein FlgK [Variovorax sp. J2R1-6]
MAGNMFLTGLSGLNVARSSLVTTAHNTANVYTAGYSRQVAQISTNGAIATGSGFVGMGALVTTTSRSYDSYLTAQLNTAQSVAAGLTSYGTQIDRIDSLLADKTSGISPLMQSFFTATQGVANTPADPAARQQLISSAQALATKFRSTDQYLTDLNGSVNDQIKGSVEQINTYATQIASLNQQISQLTATSGGQPANDLLDQRDQLVSQLSQIADIKVLEQDSGKYNVFIATGQSLVVGDRAATMMAVPSAADPTRTAVALVGLAGNVMELSPNAITGGSLGGLMSFRTETLIPTQNAIGRLSIALADAFNDQHKLGVDLTGALGQDFFAVGSPGVLSNARNTGNAVISASVTDTSALTTSDYSVEYKDVAGTPTYVVTRVSDKAPVGSFTTFPATFDGVTVALDSGAPTLGDTFTVQPTRTGARDMTVQVLDPAKVAAASPVVTGNTATNQGSGLLGKATINAGYLAAPLASNVTMSYDAATGTLSGFPATSAVTVTLADGTSTVYAAGTPVPYTAGASISFDGISVKLTGAPANGDTFTIGKNVGGVSDGSNALLLAGLQRATIIGGRTSTFNGAYAQLVSTVGNRAMEVGVAEKTQVSVAAQIKMSQQSVSGVNQDEETANLLMFQQMYQANAKVIQTASTMFDAILGISN